MGWIKSGAIFLSAVTAVHPLLTGALFAKGGVSFIARRDYLIGRGPQSSAEIWDGHGLRSVVLGDFNNDGIQDTVTVNSLDDRLTVFLGNGDGILQEAQTIGLGRNPWAVATGDFNSDGREDLVVVMAGSAIVYILLGNGNGTFRQGEWIGISGSGPRGVAVGDFNSDQRLDLAVTTANLNELSIHLGNGDGTFRRGQIISVGRKPEAVTVGDFNGDGHLDLAVGDSDSRSSTVSILLGEGNGTFRIATLETAEPEIRSIAVGDFNDDGQEDLAIAPFDGLDRIVIKLGNGDGTFRVASPVDIGRMGLVSVAIGDFNGDDRQDLAVVCGLDHPSYSDTLSIALGNGDGTFRPARTVYAGRLPSSVAIGEFNGDGLQDVALTNRGSATLSILLGNGDGTVKTANLVQHRDLGDGDSLVLRDFNGDGYLDVVIGDSQSRLHALSVFLGEGDGTFRFERNLELAGAGARSISVGDFNGDRRPDFAALTYLYDSGLSHDDVDVFVGNGDGTFRRSQTVMVRPRAFLGSLGAGDFNGDGHQDLAVTCRSPNDLALWDVAALLGNGDGTFRITFPITGLRESVGPLVVGDFNNDRRTDLAVGGPSYSEGLVIFLGNGDATFRRGQTLQVGWEVISIVPGDFNSDDRQDLVVVRDSPDGAIFLGNGDGTFQAPRTVRFGRAPGGATIGDFNGDGQLDLAVTDGHDMRRVSSWFNRGSDTVAVLLGNGDGSFQPAQHFGAGFIPTAVDSGDINKDGLEDIVAANSFESSLEGGRHFSVLINDTHRKKP
ncbi:MAG: VCBS repeat-containing protein [Elusimicrobia bacterium]|nr:VCBS repeat-containing protein [Elusimicrobiota bacterium]